MQPSALSVRGKPMYGMHTLSAARSVSLPFPTAALPLTCALTCGSQPPCAQRTAYALLLLLAAEYREAAELSIILNGRGLLEPLHIIGHDGEVGRRGNSPMAAGCE